jgi:hypothetical protein
MTVPRRASVASVASVASRARLGALFALAGAVAVVVTGCPPSLDDPEAFQTACPAGFSVDALFRETCAVAGCHVSGPLAASGLDLATPDAFSRMYGQASLCGPPLISPEGPSQSYLLAKLEGTAACGGRMPLGGTPLSASDILCVEQWITSGIAAGPLPDAGGDEPDAGQAVDGG